MQEDGPLFRTYRVKASFVYEPDKHKIMTPFLWHTPAIDFPSSFFTIDVRLYRDDPLIEFAIDCDWWEKNKFLKMRFDSSVDSPEIDYGLAAGTITRSARQVTKTDKARFEVPAQGFAGYQDDGKSLLLLSDEKYGFNCVDGTLGLSLLTSPYHNDKNEVPDPLTDRGRHHIECALAFGCDPLGRGEMHRRSLVHRHQPRVFWGELADKQLAADGLKVDGAIPFYAKPAENGVLLYLFDADGRPGTVDITAANGRRYVKCDLLGEKQEELSSRFPIGANQLAYVLI
jgi:hypothetical protein